MSKKVNTICCRAVELLQLYGIHNVVLCPGNRNAPLITAVERNQVLKGTVVCDERSAAFIALGMAIQSGNPTAVICTSGTALLNFAPAVAEAYYRNIPLIVVSADRPTDMIDSGFAQTIRQPGALSNVVKDSVDIDSVHDSDRNVRYSERLINQALIAATTGPCGPVHINIHIDNPADTEAPEIDSCAQKIELVRPEIKLQTCDARAIGKLLAPPRKVLILAGFMAPNSVLNRAINRLAAIPNVAVVAEAVSNLHGSRIIYNGETVIASLSNDKQQLLLPDIVITIGGTLVSGQLLKWLTNSGVEHWSVSETDNIPDPFGCITRCFAMPPAVFMPQLASAMQPYSNSDVNYGCEWKALSDKALSATKKYSAKAPWSDFRAVHSAIKKLPASFNVHASNGMSVRLLLSADASRLHRVECNRGVSGIDGCTSTAIGAAMVTDTPTLLITGDMSAQYDIGALACTEIPASFRMMVLSNDGGNIFRVVASTRNLAERERCFACEVNLPMRNLSEGYGFDYYEATDNDTFDDAFAQFISPSKRPAILNIIVDGPTSAEVYANYLNHLKNL